MRLTIPIRLAGGPIGVLVLAMTFGMAPSSALGVGGVGGAARRSGPPVSELDVSPTAIAVSYRLDGRRLELRIPQALAWFALEDLSADGVPRIEVRVDHESVELPADVSLAFAFELARERLRPGLSPAGVDGASTNLNADDSHFAEMNRRLIGQLQDIDARDRNLARLWRSAVETDRARVPWRLTAQGVAAGILVIAHERDLHIRTRVGRLVERFARSVLRPDR